MNRKSPQQVAAPGIVPDCNDEDDYKDIFWPEFDAAPDEAPVVYKLRFAFTSAGYRVMGVEEAETHPVLIVRAVRTTARRITEHQTFLRHIQDLLLRAGFRVRRDELAVAQSGDRILAAFQWKDSPVDYEARLRQAEHDAAELAGMPL